jgi:hypothetical protein
MRTIAMRAS